MMQLIAVLPQIYLIYIVIPFGDCSVHDGETTKYLQTRFNQYEFLFTIDEKSQYKDIVPQNIVHNNDKQYNEKHYLNTESKSTRGILRRANGNDRSHNVMNQSRISAEKDTTDNARLKRNTERQDLCETDECQCNFKAKFLTIDCHFQRHYTLGLNKIVRRSAETLLIHLSADSEFRVDGNVFNENRLNRLLIEGSNSKAGREHVEIGANAFNGNAGPFPEIDIVNVHTVIIRSNAFFKEFKLNVTNCTKLWVFPEAFANTTFHGHFENIRDFQLLERGFSKSNAKIFIRNSKLDELQRLDASLKEIKFSDTHIGEIKANAFDVLAINSIIFENCQIDKIESKALTEKLFSNHFALIGCNVGIIETAAVAGSGIENVIFQNNSINAIQAKAITLTAITTLIQNNNINLLDRFWFRVEKWSSIIIENNRFGVYKQMGIETTENPIKCLFANNFITKTSVDSLNFKSPHCRIKQVSFDQPCSCNSTYFRQLSYIDISSESFCKIDTTLAHCFNASLYNVKAYKEEICDDSAQIDCIKNRAHAKTNGHFIDLNRIFNREDKLVYIYVGGGILLVIMATGLLIAIVRRCVRHKKQCDDSPMRDIMLMESLHCSSAPTIKQATQPRHNFNSFSNTDLTIMQRTLHEMKLQYPPEMYDQVHNNTVKLIAGNLTETDKVRTIDEIVRNMVDCENANMNFVAFTDILYNHLGDETMHRANDTVYAEPNRTQLNGIAMLSTEHKNRAYDGVNVGIVNDDSIAAGGEPIYAEPMHLQQPLLRNEYNVPVDLSNNTNYFYAEPVIQAIDNNFPTSLPNAATTTSSAFDPSQLYALPSTSNAHRANYKNSPPNEQTSSTSFSNPTNANGILPKNSNLSDQFMNNSHSSSQESNQSCSDHSGGSVVTLELKDEAIEYADA